MNNHLDQFFRLHQLDPGAHILLGVSGGKDSMCLLHALHEGGYNISVAHVNFQLRGENSVHDADFVRRFVQDRNIPFYLKEVDARSYALELGLSIQMAARQLRYAWFHDLMAETEAQYLGLAHHADDQLETVLINVLKGYSPRMLAGMNSFAFPVIRPFLAVPREVINNYVDRNDLLFTEDSSNFDTKYLRNMIRHYVVPTLKEIEPELLDGLSRNTQILHQIFEVYDGYVDSILPDYTEEIQGVVRLRLQDLREQKGGDALVFSVLRKYGFERSHLLALKGWMLGEWPEKGRFIDTDTHRIYFYKPEVWIEPLGDLQSQINLTLNKEVVNWRGKRFRFRPASFDSKHLSQNTCFIPDALAKSGKVILRPPQEGDKIRPHNFNGSKKVSDLLAEAKIPIPLRKRTPILEVDGMVYWVAGHRSADLSSVAKEGQKGYLAQLLKE